MSLIEGLMGSALNATLKTFLLSSPEMFAIMMKKISLFFVCLMMPAVAFTAERGDCDQDVFVTIDDVTTLIDYLLNEDASAIDLAAADCNLDGNVTIDDVTSLIDYLLAGWWPYVDLGLPSGTLWAMCNVDANTPEEYGDYFAWGETEPKDNYDWSTYKWCNGSYNTLTKYCDNSSFGYNGFVDDKMELDPEDDAAYVNWGPSWRMPTAEQLQELLDNCDVFAFQQNGVNGSLVIGPNRNELFFPFAGFRRGDSQVGASSISFFWSRELHSYSYNNHPYIASVMSFDNEVYEGYCILDERCKGFTVRPVRVSQN